MAYANLVNENCATKWDWFCKMRDFLCKRNGTFDYSTTGIGWTLVDSSYAVDEDNPANGDWFVISSTGEDDSFPRYYKFTLVSTYSKIYSGLYWNTSTHSFEGDSDDADRTSFYIIDSATNFAMYIYGDLDMFGVVTWYQSSSYWTSTVVGRMEAPFGRSGTVLTTTAASYGTGTGVSVTFNEDLPSDWKVGSGLYIWGNKGEDLRIQRVKSIDAGTKTVTFDINTAISADSFCYCTNHLGLVADGNWSPFNSPYILYSPGYAGVSGVIWYFTVTTYQGIDPDLLDTDGTYPLCPIVIVKDGAGFLGIYKTDLCMGLTNPSYVTSPFSIASLDTFTDQNGDNWRLFTLGSNAYHVAFREV